MCFPAFQGVVFWNYDILKIISHSSIGKKCADFFVNLFGIISIQLTAINGKGQHVAEIITAHNIHDSRFRPSATFLLCPFGILGFSRRRNIIAPFSFNIAYTHWKD